MVMLILQIILVAIILCGIPRHILLSRRLTQLEHQIESHNKQLWEIVRNVGDLSLLTRRHKEEIMALQVTSSDVA
jgi:hypothetical protein